MKKIIRYIIFKLNFFELTYMYFNDYSRYLKHNLKRKHLKLNEKQLKSKLIKTYHSIEKGLSYSNFKYGFGESDVTLLIELLEIYEEKKIKIDLVYEYSVSALKNYLNKHSEMVNFITIRKIHHFFNNRHLNLESHNSIINISKRDLVKNFQIDFKSFAYSRHSVRNYGSGEVSNNDLIESIKISLKTPSVCNRQGWRVRILQNPEYIDILRENQNGNRNWGHLANKYLIITHDINTLNYPRERNQGYVDGGLFAMSLLYALHSNGIASCALNACLSKIQNKNLRAKIKIKDNENIIMFIAVGNYPEQFRVPASKRMNVENFYEIL